MNVISNNQSYPQIDSWSWSQQKKSKWWWYCTGEVMSFRLDEETHCQKCRIHFIAFILLSCMHPPYIQMHVINCSIWANEWPATASTEASRGTKSGGWYVPSENVVPASPLQERLFMDGIELRGRRDAARHIEQNGRRRKRRRGETWRWRILCCSLCFWLNLPTFNFGLPVINLPPLLTQALTYLFTFIYFILLYARRCQCAKSLTL